jgi:hypothetical protein
VQVLLYCSSVSLQDKSKLAQKIKCRSKKSETEIASISLFDSVYTGGSS